MHPDMFTFVLMKDSGITGNLEIHVRPKSIDRTGMKLVHSKKQGQGYPSSDWDAFHARIDAALKEVQK